VVESICSAPAAKTCPSSCQAFRFGFGFARVSRPGLNVQYNCKLDQRDVVRFSPSSRLLFLSSTSPLRGALCARPRRGTADGFFAFCST
jgi:hypothetical protein